MRVFHQSHKSLTLQFAMHPKSGFEAAPSSGKYLNSTGLLYGNVL
jgi:hypothetical protein